MRTQTMPTKETMVNENSKILTIKDLHKTSWKGLFTILKLRGTLGKWPFYLSLFLSVLTTVLMFIREIDKSYDVLIKTADLFTTVFPGLLGFSLGGYAIVVGFSNTELIKESSKRDKASVYQLLNSIFTLSLLIQVFTTIVSFFLSWVIKIDILPQLSSLLLSNIVNLSIMLCLLFGAIYSLLLTPYIVINLFTLSQMNNLFFTIEKIKDES